MGTMSAIVFSCFGASYGMAKSGVGIMSAGVLRPDRIIQSMTQDWILGEIELTSETGLMPTIMAGILAIYGLVISVLISSTLSSTRLVPLAASMIQLGAGIAVGLSALAAGFSIGIVGDAGVRASAQQPRLYVGMMLILIFAEVLGLYGFIVAILMMSGLEFDSVCGQ